MILVSDVNKSDNWNAECLRGRQIPDQSGLQSLRCIDVIYCAFCSQIYVKIIFFALDSLEIVLKTLLSDWFCHVLSKNVADQVPYALVCCSCCLGVTKLGRQVIMCLGALWRLGPARWMSAGCPMCSYSVPGTDVSRQKYKWSPMCWYICRGRYAFRPMCTECPRCSYNAPCTSVFRPRYTGYLTCLYNARGTGVCRPMYTI